jgi:hypothetical protein
MFNITNQEALSIASLLSCASKDKFQPAFDRVWLRFEPATNKLTGFATDKYVMAQVEFVATPGEATNATDEIAYFGLDKVAIAQLKAFAKEKGNSRITFDLDGFATNTSRYLLSNAWLASDEARPTTTDMVFNLLANMHQQLGSITLAPGAEAAATISLARMAQLTKLVSPAEKADDVFAIRFTPSADKKPKPIMLSKLGITALIQPTLLKA